MRAILPWDLIHCCTTTLCPCLPCRLLLLRRQWYHLSFAAAAVGGGGGVGIEYRWSPKNLTPTHTATQDNPKPETEARATNHTFFLQREMEQGVCRNTVSKKGELRFSVAPPFFSVKPPSSSSLLPYFLSSLLRSSQREKKAHLFIHARTGTDEPGFPKLSVQKCFFKNI